MQIHGINGMIDQYYVESLPHLLQELDDVYHDVSAVVLESLTEGSNKITEKVGQLLIANGIYEVFPQTLNMTNRWKKTSEDVQAISAPKVNPPTFLQMDASCQKCLPASQPELFCRISPASSPASPFPTLSQSQNTTSSRHQ